jgi:hypothetical protein
MRANTLNISEFEDIVLFMKEIIETEVFFFRGKNDFRRSCSLHDKKVEDFRSSD